MKKRVRGAALLLAVCLLLGGCGISMQEHYERGQLYLGIGDYETARDIFSQLGNYAEAPHYAMYAAALQAMRTGSWALAEANLRLIAPFAQSGWCLRYIAAAKQAEEGGLADALAGFEALGSFLDSAEQAEKLREKIPLQALARAEAMLDSGHYAEARTLLESLEPSQKQMELLTRCETEQLTAKYDQACALYQSRQWQAAKDAFEALGEYRDSAAWAMTCRSELYSAAEKAYQTVTMETASAVMAAYQQLEDYLNSNGRLEELEARWDTNLLLAASAKEQPYVVFGSYPLTESGEPAPLIWRVVDVTADRVTLLSCQVLDAMPAAEAAALELGLNAAEAAAKQVLSLPTAAQVGENRICKATAYALAQGVRHHADGGAWYALAEDAGNGYQAVVWYNGQINRVRADYAGTGVRPVVTFSLNDYAFTAGNGTAENPFR